MYMKNAASQSSYIMLEGNIGAGKSTFLKIMSEYLNIQPIYEPHEKWQHVSGENILEKFYQDTKRWAYTFQTYAFVTRVVEQEKYATQLPYIPHVVERSVYSDRYCFAHNCFEMGSMTSLEWKLYQEWFAWLVENYTTKPAGFIYMRTDPQVCYQRMCKRSRTEESAVPLDYLQKLHDKHEQWLIHKQDVAPYIRDIPVLILECNTDFEHNKKEQEKHIGRIIEFFDMVRIKQHEQQAVIDTAN